MGSSLVLIRLKHNIKNGLKIVCQYSVTNDEISSIFYLYSIVIFM
jgi:hypothetical protein